ncbi:MAG TPA: 50S ribosomal protein L6 [Tepiditoga sp.]|nr:50S ribosomal protein L6 [Thermotogota bacterium]HOO74035.1 50S ribosomal protein L6 [Tepiditoga sp.]
MSRIADKPTVIPQGVEVKFENGILTVKGKKEELSMEVISELAVEIKENELLVVANKVLSNRKSNEKRLTALRGTFTSHIRNMIDGVTKGFTKELEIVGIGYRASLQGSKLIMNLGYSHPIEFDAPKGITIEVPAPNKVNVKGSDKYLVGETAAKIRKFRQPNVYSGKGVRYLGEVINLKEGKKV